jgi:hypothetical protein
MNKMADLTQVRDLPRILWVKDWYDLNSRTAVLLDVVEYESLIERLQVLQDIQTAEAQIAAGYGIPHAEVERRLKQTIGR